MFGRSNQFATVASFGVRVKDERERDRNHLIEVTFELPLTRDLADEISPAMARDLYQETAGEYTPKAELQDAGFNLLPDTQIMTVKQHPDLEPIFRAAGVTIRKIKAKKGDANAWVLQFTTTWALTQDVEAMAMIRALKSGIYLTMEAQQMRLEDAGQAPENNQEARVDGSGNVESIGSRKKRRNKPNGATHDTPGASADAPAQE